jgi:UDP-glucose 4-epimerase
LQRPSGSPERYRLRLLLSECARMACNAGGGQTRQAWLDITRLRRDTGYKPAWDTERAAADYIAWLRAGNER